jgi:acetolactate synthase small subunit
MVPEPSTAAQAVVVLLDESLLTLSRTLGLLRRRSFPLEGLVVSPSGTTGLSRMSFITNADTDAVARMAHQVGRVVGVRQVLVGSPAATPTDILPSSPYIVTEVES